MDELKIKNLFNMPGKTKEELLDEQVRQQVDNQMIKEEMMISQLPPDQQAAARTELFKRTINQKISDPLEEEVMRLKGQRRPTPEQQVLMERSAMERYNSPEAKAIRDRFSGQPSTVSVMPPGLLDSKPRLRKPTPVPESRLANEDFDLDNEEE